MAVLWYSILAGLATCLGGILAVVIQKPGGRFLAATLGCAAGIMLAVALFDLIPSAWLYGTLLKFAIGLIMGIFLLKMLDLTLSKATMGVSRERDRRYLLNLGYLVAIGIALHDLPEGMAIAVGYEAANKLNIVIALAIGLHNIPEGMAIGIPLKMGGMKGRVILLITALASIFTPLGTLIGLILVSFSQNFISILLAAAAGAMLYIVFKDIWPEAKRRHPNFARLGMALGVFIMILVKIIH